MDRVKFTNGPDTWFWAPKHKVVQWRKRNKQYIGVVNF